MKRAILLLLVVAACGPSSTKVIERKYDVLAPLPEKQMISIFRDYYITEGVNSVRRTGDLLAGKEKDTLRYLDTIIVLHGYTRPLFDSTIKIYLSDLEYYSYIYEKVINELSKLEAENGKPKKK